MVRAESVGFAYDSRPVLSGVSVELHAGELLGLIGPNGAGKTTLLQILNGFLLPTAGAVYVQGRQLSTIPRREIAHMVAVVPQQSQTAFAYSVIQVVLMGRHPYAGFAALDSREDLQIAREALATTGLSGFEERRFDQLSGGEQRLVLIARALAQQTNVLLLDEPLAELDLRYQWRILKLIKALVSDGKAVLATFHDLNAAGQWCDRIAILHEGGVQACGQPEEVLQLEKLQQVYGLPLSWSTARRIDFEPTP